MIVSFLKEPLRGFVLDNDYDAREIWRRNYYGLRPPKSYKKV